MISVVEAFPHLISPLHPKKNMNLYLTSLKSYRQLCSKEMQLKYKRTKQNTHTKKRSWKTIG